nr:hypothetical protein MarFTME_307 [Marseillevirus futianmevirus]
MQSELLPILEEYLQKELLVSKEEYETKIEPSIVVAGDGIPAEDGISCRIFLCGTREELCKWSEFPKENGETLFDVDWSFRSKERSIHLLKLFIWENKKVRLIQLDKLKRTLELNKLLIQENEGLSERNEKLRSKNRELRYSPGGSGFEKTKQHFMGLI